MLLAVRAGVLAVESMEEEGGGVVVGVIDRGLVAFEAGGAPFVHPVFVVVQVAAMAEVMGLAVVAVADEELSITYSLSSTIL